MKNFSSSHLLKYFEQVAEAPDAIPRLRRFILDLAVRGKLVEQDPKDESVSELVKRIEKGKLQLVKKGLIKEQKSLEPFDEKEYLYSLPMSWKWLCLCEVGAIIGGGTPPSKDDSCFTNGGSGIPWLTPADLGKHDSLFISHGARDLTPKGLSNSSAQLMPAGSVLFTSRAPIGYTAIAANEISTNQGFKSVVPFILEFNTYIAIYFKAFASWIDSKASGTTFKEVSGKIVRSLPFPLPPLSEQHRIVAKVDELMALCDELENAQAKRESRRDRLVAATLHGLNNSDANPEPDTSVSFSESARFYFNHLPRLTTRPEHIQQLRQTILNFAVRGKLVPQDLQEVPAADLLKRIEAEKKSLIKVGTLNNLKTFFPIADKEKPFKLPQGWEWSRTQDVFLTVTDGDHQPPPKAEDGVPFLVIGNVRRGKVDFSGCRYVLEHYYKALNWMSRPLKGDILYTLVGSYGIPVLLLDDRVFCVQRHIGILRPPKQVNAGFLTLALESALVFDQATNCATGIAQKTVPLSGLRKILIPLPPQAEQHRIVAKVNELMALCDDLEAQLTSTTATRRQLLEATLHEALN